MDINEIAKKVRGREIKLFLPTKVLNPEERVAGLYVGLNIYLAKMMENVRNENRKDSSATLNKWGLVVTDDDHKISWFDLLFQYDFIRTWYLDNLSSLEIQSNPLYF